MTSEGLLDRELVFKVQLHFHYAFLMFQYVNVHYTDDVGRAVTLDMHEINVNSPAKLMDQPPLP